MMCKFWKIVNRYVDESDWKTFTLLKTCLFALGVLCGMSVRKKDKEAVTVAAGTVFVGCYIPLMVKLARIVLGELHPAKVEQSEEEVEPEQVPEEEQAAEPEQAPEEEQTPEEDPSADEPAAEAEESDEAEPEAEQTEAEPEE